MNDQELLRALLPLIAVNLILAVTALISLYKAESVGGGNKWIWVPLILFIQIIGPILYFTMGKKGND